MTFRVNNHILIIKNNTHK